MYVGGEWGEWGELNPYYRKSQNQIIKKNKNKNYLCIGNI